uniref:Retrotransposon protein, putative, unclassified n=1 Tax=Oryza sativa subsp. japonica TaxID=39947 RepID=Q2QPR6_ORYSJ|nr:retrotransposon protein, putative, unclassified [Oryza sativa Japonica Group]
MVGLGWLGTSWDPGSGCQFGLNHRRPWVKADGTSEEAALDLINDAQKAADKIAVDVVKRFQDNDLRTTGSNNSDDGKTETD